MIGFIYFIKAGQRFKIGFSKNPDKRIRGLQTGSGEKLELLGRVPGSVLQEKQVHRMLRPAKLTGEWFDGTIVVTRFVQDALTYGLSAAISELLNKNLAREWSEINGSEKLSYRRDNLSRKQRRKSAMQADVDSFAA